MSPLGPIWEPTGLFLMKTKLNCLIGREHDRSFIGSALAQATGGVVARVCVCCRSKKNPKRAVRLGFLVKFTHQTIRA